MIIEDKILGCILSCLKLKKYKRLFVSSGLYNTVTSMNVNI